MLALLINYNFSKRFLTYSINFHFYLIPHIDSFQSPEELTLATCYITVLR
jgi:hypothetical protein